MLQYELNNIRDTAIITSLTKIGIIKTVATKTVIIGVLLLL